ncbi:MAG: type II toxin-antitoxin system prevent-host-death family antitoxin [Roseateles sp.]|uniref:type II toxin-antitoxin system Phd/YefM family antitoxin n=1 Tax=Roseateles sp. TaxID=1971397 RepID=UPI0039E9C063
MSAHIVPATVFKAHCLRLLDEVERSKAPLTITKHGRPVARMVPIEPAQAPDLFGAMRGSVVRQGDLLAPLDEDWGAER